jgi:stage III sporulation protein AH
MTKPLILASCVAVVGLSVYADWNFTKKIVNDPGGYIYNSAVSGDKVKILGEATFVGNTGDATDTVSEGYFANAAYERQRQRDETLEILQTVVDSSESMPDAKNKALESMTQIASYMESEANIETLIKAKGFDDCVAVISENGINVIVKTTGLLTYEVAQIREIVMNELKIPAENIKIIEKTN